VSHTHLAVSRPSLSRARFRRPRSRCRPVCLSSCSASSGWFDFLLTSFSSTRAHPSLVPWSEDQGSI
jgi:hypothetical protein